MATMICSTRLQTVDTQAARYDGDFVTADRLNAAVAYAGKLASQKPSLTGGQCADEAVRKIFGEWLLDWSASIRPGSLPRFFQLTSKVENRLDLHRCHALRKALPNPPLPQRSPMPLAMQAPLMALAMPELAA